MVFEADPRSVRRYYRSFGELHAKMRFVEQSHSSTSVGAGETSARKLSLTVSLPRLASFAVLFSVAAYVLFGVFHIETPGLQYDESLFVNAALGNLDGSFAIYSIKFFGHDIVLMCMPYIGALKAWIWSPVFALFGVSPLTVRLPALIVGSAAIVVTFYYVRRIFDERVAVVSVVLLAFDPSFIFGTRLDWGPVAIMSLLKAAVLYTGYRAWTEESKRFAMFAGLLLGLGIFDKTNFGWLLLASTGALILCYPRKFIVKLRVLSPIFAAGVSITIIPLVIYNIAVPFGTLLGQFAKTGPFLEILGQRVGVLHSVLNGQAVMNLVSSGQIGGQSRSYQAPETALWLALQISFALLALGVVRRKVDRRLIFIVTLAAFIFLQIVLTPNASGPHHALFIYPFPHILIAYMATRIAYLIRDRITFAKTYAFGILAFLLLSLVTSEAIADFAYIGYFMSTGGAGAWSDKIYALEEMLPRKPSNRVAFMDWGFDTQLNGLSHDKIAHEEDFPNLWESTLSNTEIDKQLASVIDRDKVFVFHSTTFANYPLVRQRFDNYLNSHRIQSVVHEIRQEDNVPVYDVITLGNTAVAGLITSGSTTLKAAVPAAVGGISFTADPINLQSGQSVGITTLHWSTPYKAISIFVGNKDGTLFTNQDGVGSAQTGPWASDGMRFFLEREARPGDPKSFVTIATVLVHAGGP